MTPDEGSEIVILKYLAALLGREHRVTGGQARQIGRLGLHSLNYQGGTASYTRKLVTR